MRVILRPMSAAQKSDQSSGPATSDRKGWEYCFFDKYGRVAGGKEMDRLITEGWTVQSFTADANNQCQFLLKRPRQ